MGLLSKIRTGVERFDKIKSFRNDSWIFWERSNLFSWYSPIGRFVFHPSAKNLQDLIPTLISAIQSKKITAFKYAIIPLPDEKDPAVVVYATIQEKENARRVLDDIGIGQYGWRDGNPTNLGIGTFQ